MRGRWARIQIWLGHGLRTLTLIAIVGALARPTCTRAVRRTSVIALLDVSNSVDAEALTSLESTLRLATTAAQRRGDLDWRVLRFGGAVAEPAQAASSAARPPEAQADATDLEGAIDRGLALLDPASEGRLLLLSDGRPTRGDALAAAARVALRGASMSFIMPPPRRRPDVAITRIEAPEVVRPGATFDLTIHLNATAPAQVRLTLTRDGAPIEGIGDRLAEVVPGGTVVRWPTRLEGHQPVLYRAEIGASADNAEPRNDAAVLALVPETRPRVLVLESTSGSMSAFSRALEAEQIDVDRRSSAGLSAADSLTAYDLVVLSDLPGSRLHAADWATLARFVREQGGGLVVTGGGEGFGRDGYVGTPIEELLPLRRQAVEEHAPSTLALALVIDRSGSMSGAKMDLTKEAARGTAELLAADDLITVVTFDSQAQTVVRLQPASNRQRILGDLARIHAGGGTNILSGLREAFDQLLPALARKKHVIVLSDGQSPSDGIEDLVEEAAAAHITVSSVGVGDGADLALLQLIAGRGGGRFYHARDPASIPRIFTRETTEVSAPTGSERANHVIVTRPAEVTAGIDFAAAPPLGGVSRTRARRGAEVLLSAGQGDPLLARWQQGLGQVVLWTSDLTPHWSADLLRWPSFNKLWGQIIRSALRRQTGATLPLTATLDGDRLRVEVPARDADGRPSSGLAGSLAITEIPERGPIPPRPTQTLSLRETRPGLYEGELPVTGAAILIEAQLSGVAGSPVRLARGRLTRPLSPELSLDPDAAEDALRPLAGRALLTALAGLTDGRELTPDQTEELFSPIDTRPRRPVDLRGVLTALALALFLADLAVRRVNFRALGSRAAGVARRQRGPGQN